MKNYTTRGKRLFNSDEQLQVSDQDEKLPPKKANRKAIIRENIMERFNEDTEKYKGMIIDICSDGEETDAGLTIYKNIVNGKAREIDILDLPPDKSKLEQKPGSQAAPILIESSDERLEDGGPGFMEIDSNEVDSFINDEEDDCEEDDCEEDGEWEHEENNGEIQPYSDTVMRSQRLENNNMRSAFKLLEAGNYQGFLNSKIIQARFIDAFDLLNKFGYGYRKDTLIEAWDLHWEGRLVIFIGDNAYRAQCCFCNCAKNVRVYFYEDSIYGRLIGVSGTDCHPRFKRLMELTDVCYELLQSTDDEAFESIAEAMLKSVLSNVRFAQVLKK